MKLKKFVKKMKKLVKKYPDHIIVLSSDEEVPDNKEDMRVSKATCPSCNITLPIDFDTIEEMVY